MTTGSSGRFIFTCLVENRLATPVQASSLPKISCCRFNLCSMPEQVVGISGFCDLAPAPLDLQAFTAGTDLSQLTDIRLRVMTAA